MKTKNIQLQGKQFIQFYKDNSGFDIMTFDFSIKKLSQNLH